MKIIFCLTFALILQNGLFAQALVIKDANKKNYLDFKVLESKQQAGSFIKGDIDSLQFQPYGGGMMPSSFPKSNRMLMLRADFILDSLCLKEELVVVSPPIFYACNIYLNAVKLASRGSVNQNLTNKSHTTEYYNLPNSLLHFGKNEIALELLTFHGEKTPIETLFITTRENGESYAFWRMFFSINFIKAMSLVSFVIGLYFLIFYFTRWQKRTSYYLPFALLCFSYIASYLNNIFTYSSGNTLLIEKLTKTGLVFWSICTLLYLMEYTNIVKNKKIFGALALISFVPGLFKISNATNVNEILAYYSTYLSFPSLCVGSFAMAICVAFYLKQASKQAKIVLIVNLLAIPAYAYDSYYVLFKQTKPYALMLPYIMFLGILVFFFIVAWEQSEVYRLLLENTKALKQMNENLELMVEERTRELKETNDMKDKFFNIIAHDLRNPFFNILGYSELLASNLKSYDNEKIMYFIETIRKSALNSHKLLENLLDWSLSQTGQLEFQPANFNLKNLVNEVKGILEGMILNKEIEFHDEIPKEIHIVADKNMTATVLRNLLTNAIKYTPRKGNVRLTCNISDPYIVISILDSGVGFTKKQLESLFKINKKIKTVGTEDENGTGLGLLICKEFINMHSGEIWIESLAKGSKVSFSLPYTL